MVCPLLTQSGHRHAKGLSCCPVTRHMLRLLRHKGAQSANIDRLKGLLKTETNPTKRAMEARLLAEEELKQKQLPAYNKSETKAY